MIELRGVNKTFCDRKGRKTEVLKNINVSFGEKGLVFILGKNNSVLLDVILGFIKVDSGEVIINGKSTKDFIFKDFEAYRHTCTGFIFQDFNLLKDDFVYQGISFALEMQDKMVDNKKIDEILKKFEIDNIRNKRICELSSYEKVKVSIAMALVKNPDMLFVSEDLENFDSEYIDDFCGVLKVLSEEKLVIVVSQNRELAKKYASYVIELKDGSIVNDTNTLEDSYNSINTLNLRYAKLPFRYRFK